MLKFSRSITLANSNLLRNVISRSYTNTVSDSVLDKTRISKLGVAAKAPSVEEPVSKVKNTENVQNRDYKYIYPDFLPNPVYYFRDKIREKLERRDMINRRKQINIPEFYVGCVLAVTVSDPYAPGKVNRFVGICIHRDEYGLRHSFTMRNNIDGLGIEIVYDLYNPTIQKIEVLKLEKRLDDNLTYLQDCPPEYSTIPFDFQPVKLPPGAKIPINTTKIPLNPRPWRHRWDRKPLKGAIYPEQKRADHEKFVKSGSDYKPYTRYDMMKHYRESIHDEDQKEIFSDIVHHESEAEVKKEVITSSKKLVKGRQLPKQ